MNKELQSFTYISNHDLQEPLQKIKTLMSYIVERENDKLSEKGKEYLKKIREAADRMQSLMIDLLSYSRTNMGEKVFKSVDLNDILNEVLEELKDQIHAKKAVIEAEEMCTATIIPLQFRQLLLNLIDNALKFTSSLTTPRILVRSKITSGSNLVNTKFDNTVRYCHISIEDNGIGFRQEYSERMFELFQQLHDRSKYGGTGVGLAIVKKIVENHDGYISATGQPGEGANLIFTFH